MRLYGTIYVAMHGPAKLLRQAAELMEGDVYEEAGTIRDNLLESIADCEEEKVVVAYWDDQKDSNEDLRGYLNTLEVIAQKVPSLDIAVAARVCNSISDSWHYSSYYSPAGSNTLKPDDFDNYRRSSITGAGVQLRVVDHEGKAQTYDLYDEDEWNFFGEDVYFNPEEVSYMYEIACEQLEDKPLLLRMFDYKDYDKMVLEVSRTPDTLVPNQEGKIVVETFDSSKMEFVTVEIDVTKAEGVTWKEIEPYFLIPVYGQNRPEWSLERLEKIVRYLRCLYPEDDIQAELVKGRPYIHNKDGIEYFPGSMAELYEGSQSTVVKWGFPEEAQEWIPIPTEL